MDPDVNPKPLTRSSKIPGVNLGGTQNIPLGFRIRVWFWGFRIPLGFGDWGLVLGFRVLGCWGD